MFASVSAAFLSPSPLQEILSALRLQFSPRLAVSLFFLINGLGFASLAPHFPWLKDKFELSEASMGLLLLIPAIGAVSMMLLTGRLIQRVGSRLLVGIGAVLMLTLIPTLLWLDQIFILGLALLLAGAGIGMMDVSMNAQAALVEKDYGRPIMSSFHGIWSFGAMTGGASAAFALHLSFSPLQHVLAMVSILSIVLLVSYRFLLEHQEEPAAEESPLITIPKGPVLGLGLLTMLGMISEGAATDWSAIYATTVLAATPTQAATTFTIFTLTMMLGRLTGDYMVQRLGRPQVVRLAATLGAVGLALGLLWGSILSAWIGFACLGFGLANVVPIMFSAASQLPGVPSGTGIAGVATLGYFGFLFGPPLIGFVAEWLGLRSSLLIIVLFCVILAAMGPRLLRGSSSKSSTDLS